ncbi:MAG: hypothetical protein J5826_05740 [Bacteroidales bacterium]|nr:hypothetical protein [Bacteroidales bacterium]
METKKSPRADLESKRGIMFLIGLAISLGLIFAVFNYEKPKPTFEEVTVTIQAGSLEIIEINSAP